jgi:hypothetical protein
MMKMARLQQCGGMKKDGWRVLVGFLYHMTIKVWGNQPGMHNCVCWELQVDETVLTGFFGNMSLSC